MEGGKDMKKIIKSSLALLLVLITIFSIVSVATFAEDIEEANSEYQAVVEKNIKVATVKQVAGEKETNEEAEKELPEIKLNLGEGEFSANEKFQLKSNAPNTKYTTTDKKLFINEKGVMSFAKDISVHVGHKFTASAEGYKDTVFWVGVSNPVTGIKFYNLNATKGCRTNVGKTHCIKFNTTGKGYARCHTISVKSSNPKVVRLTYKQHTEEQRNRYYWEFLYIKCLKQGISTITITTSNGVKKSFKVYSQRNPLKANIGVGEKLKFYRDAKKPDIRVGNKKVARINGKVGIVGKKVGSTTATVLLNKCREQIKVKVYKAPSKITLNKKAITLGKNKSYKLVSHVNKGAASRNRVFWSKNKKVAVVSKTGVVTAKGSGSCYVYVKTYNKKIARCKVTVKGAPKKVILSKSIVYANASLYYEWSANKQNHNKDYIQISAKTDNGVAGHFTYTSSNTNIIKVNKKGRIYVQDCIDYNGSWMYGNTAYVTVKAYNGVSAKLKVIVRNDRNECAKSTPLYKSGTGWQKGWAVNKIKQVIPNAVETPISKKNLELRKIYNEGQQWTGEYRSVNNWFHAHFLIICSPSYPKEDMEWDWDAVAKINIDNFAKMGYTHYAVICYQGKNSGMTSTIVMW